jgi:hypothetical protein
MPLSLMTIIATVFDFAVINRPVFLDTGGVNTQTRLWPFGLAM